MGCTCVSCWFCSGHNIAQAELSVCCSQRYTTSAGCVSVSGNRYITHEQLCQDSIHDCATLQPLQAKRHAAHTSKNRVQIPAQHQDKLGTTVPPVCLHASIALQGHYEQQHSSISSYALYVHGCASIVCLAFAEQQHEAQCASQPVDFWDTGKGMDLGAVVRDLQGTSTHPVLGHSNAQHHAKSDHSDLARQHHDGKSGSAGADRVLHIFSLHDIAPALC